LRKVPIRFSKLTVALVALLTLSQLTLLAANFHTRRRAERLLSSLRTLKVGSSTINDVQTILAGYNPEKIPIDSGCPSGEVAYGVRVSNDFISKIGGNHPILLRAGIRPWGVSAALSFKDGRLCDLHYSTSALLLEDQYPLKIPNMPSGQLIELDTETAVQAANGGATYEIRPYRALLRGFRESGSHLGLNVVVTPDATPSEMDHALAFDLSCFTSFRGCRARCQMLPLATRDAVEKNRNQPIPSSEILEKESELSICSVAPLGNR